MSELNQSFRQLERFLFRGAPERAESTYERDSNAYVNDRITGRPQFFDEHDCAGTEGYKLIAVITHHSDGRTEIVRKDGKSDIAIS